MCFFFFFFYDAGDCKNKAKCGSEISLFRSGKRGVAMRITVIVCVCVSVCDEPPDGKDRKTWFLELLKIPRESKKSVVNVGWGDGEVGTEKCLVFCQAKELRPTSFCLQ